MHGVTVAADLIHPKAPPVRDSELRAALHRASHHLPPTWPRRQRPLQEGRRSTNLHLHHYDLHRHGHRHRGHPRPRRRRRRDLRAQRRGLRLFPVHQPGWQHRRRPEQVPVSPPPVSTTVSGTSIKDGTSPARPSPPGCPRRRRPLSRQAAPTTTGPPRHPPSGSPTSSS